MADLDLKRFSSPTGFPQVVDKDPVALQARKCRDTSRKLQLIGPDGRAEIISKLADLLLERETEILAANQVGVMIQQ